MSELRQECRFVMYNICGAMDKKLDLSGLYVDPPPEALVLATCALREVLAQSAVWDQTTPTILLNDLLCQICARGFVPPIAWSALRRLVDAGAVSLSQTSDSYQVEIHSTAAKLQAYFAAPEIERDAERVDNEQYLIERRGDIVTIQFGSEMGAFPNSRFKALAYVVILVRSPHKSLEALVLEGTPLDRLPALDGADHEILDLEAVASLRQRRQDLEEEVADAKARGDVAGQEAAQAESEKITDELKTKHGLNGRPRRLGSSARQQATDRVAHSLRRLREEFRKQGLPELAEHLRTSIRQESGCFAYRPEGTVAWAVRA